MVFNVKMSKRELEMRDGTIKEFQAKIQTWELVDVAELKETRETSKEKEKYIDIYKKTKAKGWGLEWDIWQLQYQPGISSKDSCVEDLVPKTARYRGGAFEKWLDQKASDLISGLSHWWTIGSRAWPEEGH